MGLMQDRGYDGFDWDAGNRRKNWHGHRVTDEEAEEAFSSDEFYDYDASRFRGTEKRRIVLAKTKAGRFLFVAYTERNRKVRVICARDMHRVERKIYHEQIEENTGI